MCNFRLELISKIIRMDRIDSLLQTLLEQRTANASVNTLLNTVSLLQFELQKVQFQPLQELGTSKVSVLLPAGNLGVPISKSTITKESTSVAVPTVPKEVNEVVVADPTLNDRLRDEKPMLAETMQGGPIKDLRKGISLNERYQLVKELFDGDESRFDKAIKTINGFSILAEAQFWMDKELRSKPDWPSNSSSAILLDQLVKRRFS
jgi:hypothetical protein